MGGSQKSKRITWAPDVNHRQMKLFSSAKPPSEVGMGSQHRLQAKASRPVEPDMPPGFGKPANLKLPRIPLSKPPSEVGMGSQHSLQAKASWPVEPDMPPGFEKPANLKLPRIPLSKPPSEVGMGCQHHLQAKASWPVEPNMPPGFGKPANLKLPRIPLKRWSCPVRIEVNSEWLVVAGEESKEIEAQVQRERRVLEAVYPRPSAIPPNPRLPVNAQESIGDDSNIPLIPIIPIEESDPSYINPVDIPQPQKEVVSSQPDGNNIVEATKAALASVLSEDQSNLIDPDLFIRILTNPKLRQHLLITREQKPSTQNIPKSKLQPKISSNSTSIPIINGGASLSAPITKTELNAPQVAAPFHQPQVGMGFASTSGPHPSPRVVKDVNYFKSLIQQHGGGGGGCVLPQFCSQSKRLMGGATQEYRKPRDWMKSRIMKPCIYFNSNRGCKNGANCGFQHDIFSSQKRVACATQVVAAKRIKLVR